jgi:hypothetical protein
MMNDIRTDICNLDKPRLIKIDKQNRGHKDRRTPRVCVLYSDYNQRIDALRVYLTEADFAKLGGHETMVGVDFYQSRRDTFLHIRVCPRLGPMLRKNMTLYVPTPSNLSISSEEGYYYPMRCEARWDSDTLIYTLPQKIKVTEVTAENRSKGSIDLEEQPTNVTQD